MQALQHVVASSFAGLLLGQGIDSFSRKHQTGVNNFEEFFRSILKNYIRKHDFQVQIPLLLACACASSAAAM